MPMLMHGQVRRPQEVRSTRKQTGGQMNGGRNHEQMRKRGDIHGVLRWPKARHRPARIFCHRPSSSTLHRLPSISMQPSGAAVASPQARAFKQASQAKQKRRRIPVEKAWTFARPGDQWAIWQGLCCEVIGEGRREVVGWEESGRLCLGEARRKWRGWSVRPLQRRQGPGATEVANASNCGHFYNDFSSLRVPIATGRGVTFGPYQSQGGSHPIPCFRSHSGQRWGELSACPFRGSASSRSHHRRQQTRHQFIHMVTKTPYYLYQTTNETAVYPYGDKNTGITLFCYTLL